MIKFYKIFILGFILLGSYEKLTARIDSPESLSNYESFGSVMATNGSMLAVAMQDEVCIYRYETNGTISLLNKIENPASWGNYFGKSLAFSGSFLAIGAPGNSVSRSGNVWLYMVSSDGTPINLGNLSRPNSQYDKFGESISMEGNLLCVGAHENDWNAGSSLKKVNAGRVYFYKIDSFGTKSLLLETPSPTNVLENDYFGQTISILENKIVVGAKGSIYTFEYDGNNLVTPKSNIQGLNLGVGAKIVQDGNFIAACSTSQNKISLHKIETNGSLTFLSEILPPSNANASQVANFGKSISFYDNLLAIGMPEATVNSHPECGSVYLYRINQSGSAEFLTTKLHPDASRTDHGMIIDEAKYYVKWGSTVGVNVNNKSLFQMWLVNNGIPYGTVINNSTMFVDSEFGLHDTKYLDFRYRVEGISRFEYKQGTISGVSFSIDGNKHCRSKEAKYGSSFSFLENKLFIGSPGHDNNHDNNYRDGAVFVENISAYLNSAPVFTSNVSISISENQPIVNFGANDPDGDSLIYEIHQSPDFSKFQINGSTGVLSFKETPDYENPTDSGTDNSYLVKVRISDGVLHNEQTITVNVTNVNEPPSLTSNGAGNTASKNVSENQTGVTTVSATDLDAGTTITYSITGGVDASKFQINGNTGVLSFKTAPNYESPTDSGANNGYVVKVRASDGALHDEQTITVNVTNVNESPSIASNGGGASATKSVSENQTGVTTVSATDLDAGTTLTYSITGGVDASKFQINGNTGVLSFKTAPNYESPTDSGANNDYVVKVRASDGVLHDEQTITVNVNNVNEHPSIILNGAGNTLSKSVSENQTEVTTVSATDTDSATTITYSISGGVDASKFQINGNSGSLSFKNAPNFENPTDSGTNNSYVVKVRASDGALHDEQTITVNVTNVNESPSIASNGGGASATKNVSENQTGVTTVSATDPDTGTTITYSITGGVDASKFQINGNTGVLTFKNAPNYENPTDSGTNNSYVVKIRASDGVLSDQQTIKVNVRNVNEPPSISSSGGGVSASKNVSENQTGVTTLSAADPDAGTTITYSISGGVDAAKFNINGNTGVLTFKNAPNYESPNDFGADNIVLQPENSRSEYDHFISILSNPAISNIWNYQLVECTPQQTSKPGIYTTNKEPLLSLYSYGPSTEEEVIENKFDDQGQLIPNPVKTITQVGRFRWNGKVEGRQFETTVWGGGAKGLSLEGGELTSESKFINLEILPRLDSNSKIVVVPLIELLEIVISEESISPLMKAFFHQEIIELMNAKPTAWAVNLKAQITNDYNSLMSILSKKIVSTDWMDVNANTSLSASLTQFYEQIGRRDYFPEANNGYVVKVRASDGALHDEQTITINVQNSNDAPDDLFLSNSSVAENQSVGSLIGLFSASDEDGLSDLQSMNFQLVNGSGDNDNPSFSLEANGTLSSDEIFDFEQKLSYQIRVKGTDPAGGSISKSFTINIIDLDDTPPVISINGSANIIHEGGINYVDPGASWTDAVDGNGSLSPNGIVDSMKVGSYQLNYSRTDQAGNSAIKVFRTVQVVDRTAPSLILNGSRKAKHQVWQEYIDPWVFSYDRVDGNLTSKVIKTGEVKIDQPGIYRLDYQVSDKSGNQAIPIFREVEVVNQAPNGLNLTNNLVEENLPSQTIIGIFNTLDPDDLNGTRNYKYELMNIQSGTALPFSLTSDGILRTATVFDFEKENKYSIRVRTTDQFGGSFEKDFTIRIVDCFRPIVETRGVIDLNGTGYRFSGEVVDRGGLSGILEKGFVWSSSPRPMIDQNRSFKIVSNGLGLKFNSVVKDLIAGKKYFFRAYARNKEGVGYGSVLDLKTVRNISPWWIDARTGVVTNWWTSSWFGSFYMNEANASWIMHSELGWLYPMESPKSGVWLWKENLGWLWTDEEFYPFLYQNTSAGWLYFYGASQNRLLFYHYRDERWLQIKNDRSTD